MSRPASTFCRSIGLVLLAVVTLTLTAGPARAHTDLVSSSPRSEALLAAPPSSVTLLFTESMDVDLSTVSLSVDGTVLGPLPLRRGEEEGSLVATTTEVPATASTARSSWEVAFRVTSVDGHPVTGSVSFDVKASGSPAPVASRVPDASVPTTTPPASGGDDGAPASSAQTTGPFWGGYVVVGGVLLLVALGVVAMMRLGRGDEDGEP